MKTPSLHGKLALALLALFFTSGLKAQITGSPSVLSVDPATATVVDSNIVVGGNSDITNMTVQIASNFYSYYDPNTDQTYSDVLAFDVNLADNFNIDGSFNSTTGVLSFTGTTSPTGWQAILRTVTFQNSGAACGPSSRQIVFLPGNRLFNPNNNHYYEYVNNYLSWPDAKAAAAALSFNGLQGYLATSTSIAENNFIWSKIVSDSWVGASYDYNELVAAGINIYANQDEAIGNVYWVTGPEKGTFISSGLSDPISQNGQYMNWNGGEPNDAGDEFYIELYSSNNGLWNDLPLGAYLPYLVEYGGMPNDVPQNITFTRSLILTSTVGGDISITDGSNNVCAGSNAITLTTSAAVSGVTIDHWESSLDNFIADISYIGSSDPSITINNLAQTTYYRSIANGNSCANAPSSSIKITAGGSVPGTLSADDILLCNNSSATISVTGNNGSIINWQSSTDNNTWSDISYTGAIYTTPQLSTGTYYYRVQVQNATCSAVFSDAITITVSSSSGTVSGSLSGSQNVCSPVNGGTITLSGYTGSIQKWQQSTDNGIVWTDISNTTETLDFSNISATTLYRAVVKNGSCNAVNTEPATVTYYASSNIWLGTVSTDYNDAANWPCTVPVDGSDIIISSSAPNMPVLDQNRSLGNITFQNNTSITLDGYDLTITGSVTGAGANGYFINETGRVKMTVPNGQSKLFPVGNSSYNPVTITNNTGSDDDFSVLLLDDVYLNGANGATVSLPHVQRTWDIEKTNANGGSGIDFVFNWNNGEAAGVTVPKLFHHNGSSWVKQTGTMSSTSNSLTYTGYIGSFSPFSVMDNTFTLPVVWQSFTAQKQGDKVNLNWQTGYEQNTKDYTVQHSANSTDWVSIGVVTAAGNAGNYNFIHQTPAKGNNYYRVLQTDIDSRSTYSAVRKIIMGKEDGTITILGNPVKNNKLVLLLNEAQTVSLLSADGKVVWQNKLNAGMQQVDVSNLSSGIYLLKSVNTATAIIISKN